MNGRVKTFDFARTRQSLWLNEISKINLRVDPADGVSDVVSVFSPEADAAESEFSSDITTQI